MEEKASDSQRRVSFAAEHQIRYIYADDHNSTKTSSSIAEAHMELTTDIPEFRGHLLFECADKNNTLAGNVDNLFREDCEFAVFSAYPPPRNSLDPLKDGLEFKENWPASSYPPPATPSFQDRSRDSMNGSFNDTAVSNSSYAVEELVNTIDLRAMIPSTAEEKLSIDAYLASIGIRFLDESIVGGMRRDTLSKSRNEVDPALRAYYLLSVKERIEYLAEFAGYLCDKACELQTGVEDARKGIDTDGLNREFLKRLRNESRGRAKLSWYCLRKLNELQFNKKIARNRTNAKEMLSLKRKELESLEAAIAEKKERIVQRRSAYDDLQKRLASSPCDDVQAAEKLQQMILDRKQLLANMAADCAIATACAKDQATEKAALEGSIAALKNENDTLRRALVVKSVSESALDKMKKDFLDYCAVLKLQLVKASKNSIIFSVYSEAVEVTVGPNFQAISCRVISGNGDPFVGLACEYHIASIVPVCLRSILGRTAILQAFKKDVEKFKARGRVEVFYVNKTLNLRLQDSTLKRACNISIDNNLDIHIGNAIVGNLYKEIPDLLVLMNDALQ